MSRTAMDEPRRAYRAAIFDMDGTLVDSEPLHLAVTRAILAHLGHDFTEQENQVWIGRSTREMWIDLVDRLGLPESVEAYLVEYDRELLRRLCPPLEAAAGAGPLVRGLAERGVPLGLASSSLRHWIAATLRAIELDGYFSVVVSGEEVAHPKPAPDIYLLAAERLGVEPSACLVFEDSPAGVASARTAGMHVIAVQTPHTPPASLAEADRVVASLACVDLDSWCFEGRRDRSELQA